MKRVFLVLILAVFNGSAFAESELHVLNITVINELKGGLERCNLFNRNFVLLKNPIPREKLNLCENSKVRVTAINESGIVTFSVVDVSTGKELPGYPSTHGQSFKLGKDHPYLSFESQNPYGMTQVIAEENKRIDVKSALQWNLLGDRADELRAKIEKLEQVGNPVPAELISEFESVLAQRRELAEEFYR